MPRPATVILVSSIANSKAMPSYTAYSESKAAIRSFARTWTLELKNRGIRVNSLSPGPVDTPIIDTQFPTREETDKLRETFAQAIPLG